MEKIIFYDGECGLCGWSVRVLARLDRKKEFRFAPLNGETYENYFKEKSNLLTVVYYHQGRSFIKSRAVLEALVGLGGVYKLASAFRFIPSVLRDKMYDLIAGLRNKVSCIILERDERFLK